MEKDNQLEIRANIAYNVMRSSSRVFYRESDLAFRVALKILPEEHTQQDIYREMKLFRSIGVMDRLVESNRVVRNSKGFYYTSSEGSDLVFH